MPITSTIEEQQSFVEAPMDQGASRRRARFSSVLRSIQGPSNGFMFSGDEKIELERFYHDDIAGGALGFNWNEPVAGIDDVVVRFATPPSFKLVVPHQNTAEQVWGVTISLYVLPLGHPGYDGFE